MRLQWGRGFSATEGEEGLRTERVTLGFNGAVASQPRKGGNDCLESMDFLGFNGAVASQPRKGQTTRDRVQHSSASMGPWLLSHGRHPYRRR